MGVEENGDIGLNIRCKGRINGFIMLRICYNLIK